ncbi:MAG: exodeoxyribonuclease I, partial [Pseudomonadota bacterium]
ADVQATIAIARLVRDRQPRLYQYLFEHRDKRSVLSMLDLERMKPLLHHHRRAGYFAGTRSHG